MKAYYYLAQAQISLNHPNEALRSAEKAYELCLQEGNKSASAIAALVLRAKKEKWDMREKARKRDANGLLKELEMKLMEAEEAEIAAITKRIESGEISATEGEEEISQILGEAGLGGTLVARGLGATTGIVFKAKALL